MKSITKTIIAAVTAAAFACPVLAEDGDKADAAQPKEKKNVKNAMGKVFKKMDANSDGKVSLEEFKETVTKREKKALSGENADKVFKRRDKDADGLLTFAEFAPKVVGKNKPKGEKKAKGDDDEDSPNKNKGEKKKKGDADVSE